MTDTSVGQVKVSIIYYSATGTIYRLAQAIAEGAEKAGAQVTLKKVRELAPEEAVASNEGWVQHRLETHAQTGQPVRKVDVGDYEPVVPWPQPLPDTDLSHAGWTWGSGAGAWAETPDKVWVAQRGEIELPAGAEPWTCACLVEPRRTNTGAEGGTAGVRAPTGRSRSYCAPSGGRGSASPALGQKESARSASAVMVSEGFTPRLAPTTEPSTTCRPG